MISPVATIREIDAKLRGLGMLPTTPNRESLRTLLDETWKAGYHAGEPNVPAESPYRVPTYEKRP